MVQDRKEPTINSIKPERDEILRHQTRASAKSSGASRPAATRQPPPKRFPAGLLALCIALVAVGATGFSYWQLQQTRQSLDMAQKRIEGLEGQLKMTAGESVESLGSINEKLEWADSEIRKLWGVSYDTNRKSIKANQDDIASLGKLAKDASDAVKGLRTTVSSLQTMSNEQQLILTKLREDSSLQQNDIDRALNLAEQMQGTVNKLEAELPQIAANREAIAAIDAFRRSVNADLLKIKQQLGQTP